MDTKSRTQDSDLAALAIGRAMQAHLPSVTADDVEALAEKVEEHGLLKKAAQAADDAMVDETHPRFRPLQKGARRRLRARAGRRGRMTAQDFYTKWRNIRIRHDDSCPRRGGFDFDECTCGLEVKR